MYKKPLIYAALGDSIATGSLTPFHRILPYPVLLKKELSHMLQQPVHLFNFACNGLTTCGLLHMLKTNFLIRQKVQQADMITICIGGNDLMQAAIIPGFTQIIPQIAHQGITHFSDCFPKVISQIQKLNPTASVVFMTIYNPYCQCNCPYLDHQLYNITESFLFKMNQIILNQVSQGIAVADIHQVFSSYRQGRMGQVVALYPPCLLRNPHPTAKGQQLITQCHLNAFQYLLLSK